VSDWKQDLHLEFSRAESARARGNEGQARVCARRAAGIAIREFLARAGTPAQGASAVDLLNAMKDDPRFPRDLEPVLEHLTVRVAENFRLPVDADLVAEARLLCRTLLPDWENK
jgi:hypothetical protein